MTRDETAQVVRVHTSCEIVAMGLHAGGVGFQEPGADHKEKGCCGCRDKSGEATEAPATAEALSIGDAPREAKRGTWHAGATR